MEENTRLAEMLIDKIEKFGKLSFDLAKLKLIRKFANVVSLMTIHIMSLFLLLLFFLFATIGLALWLGLITGKTYYGFLLVAGFNFFLFITVSICCKNSFRKYLKKCLINCLEP
jgi:hypothetical protein